MSPRLFPLRTIRRLRDDDRGVALVEFAVSIALFLLLFFALLDIGRLAYNYVTAEKALQIAARMAVVRPPICNAVPATNQRGANTDPRFGAKCNDPRGNVCVAINPAPCTGADAGLGIPGNATADEIWARIGTLMPNGATEANLRYTYSYDEDLNFLGGPFVPLVTVELVNLDFEFLGVLAGLARVAGATDTSETEELETNGVAFGLSVSLPGEDLALGTSG